MNIEDILKIDLSDSEYWAKRNAEVEQYLKDTEELRKQQDFEDKVPQRYWHTSFDSYKIENEEQQKAVKSCKDFVNAINNGAFYSLILLGPAGCGKTHLACSIVKEVANAVYKNIFEVIEEIERSKNFASKTSESEIVANYGKCRLLVIDEVGRALNAEKERYILYQIINQRYNRELPTVLISNKTSSDFLSYCGDAVEDRLIESGFVIEFKETGSYRKVIRGM